MVTSQVKLLMISPNGYLGGAERFVLRTAIEHVRLKNIYVHVLFFNSGEAERICREAGVPTSTLPFKLRLRNPWALIKTILFMKKLNREIRCNVFHATMPYAQIVCSLYRLFSGNVRLTWFQHGPVGGWLDQIAVFTAADRIFFNSRYLLEEHNRSPFAKMGRHKQQVIPLGIPSFPDVDSHELSALKEELRLNGKRIFITPGRICPWKGQGVLLQAIALLKERRPEDLAKMRFLVIGSPNLKSDRDYFDRLKQTAKDQEIEEHVSFLPHVGNLGPFYRIADALVHTSTVPEPFGLVVAEAMKSECLVLGSDVGGVRDILISEQTGFTYAACSPDAAERLSDALLRLLHLLEGDGERIRMLKNSAKSLIDSRYGLEQSTLMLEQCYGELLRATMR